ncbi:MAG TPA: FHA domain-containing protein, partial [Anaerolineales bacterium]|nr:FHA domain-containing protein [Anaerolineales bacterium]
MSKSRFIVLAVLVWLASLGLSPAAQAQTAGPTVHVHAVEPPQSVTPETGGLPGLFLRATFSLLDTDGTIMKSEIENATLRLGGDSYTAKFSKLETPWSVVVLLDTSGTMSVGRAFTDFRTVRDGLTRALGKAPEYASVALIPFSDRAPTLVEFTPDRDKLGNALKNVRPEYGKQACLNDGLYEAIAKLSSAPGRRAVFAITASADSCATRSAQMIVDFANQNHVELYAVGVDGYTITSQELAAFTQPTGGLSETRSAAELSFGLDNMIGVLANQWQAVWVVYPSEGPQTAEVNVKLPDATVLAGSLSFVSDRNYARPPTVAVAGTAQSTLGGVRFNLDIINPERIAALEVNLVSKLTGRSVYEDRLTELSDSILLPSDNLVQDGEYSLTLTVLDDQGQVLSQTQPLDFRYEPQAPALTATVQEWPTPDAPFFVISIAVQNLEGIDHYRLWLERDQGSAPLRGTEVTIDPGDQPRVPVSGVASGAYVVRVQALDASDRVLVESTGLKVAYQAPGLMSRLVAMVQGSTIAVLGVCGLGVLGAVGLGALVWFVVPRGKGARNVELVLPEKARRVPRAAEPAPRPKEPVAPPRSAPAPAAPPARAESVRPAPPKAQPMPPQQAPVAPAPPRAEPARPAPPQQAPIPAQAAPVPLAAPRVEPARPAPPQQAPIPAQPAPAPPAPPRVEPAHAAVPRPAAPPAPPASVGPAAVPKSVEVLAVVSMADPRIVPFEAEIRKVPFRIGRSSDNDGVLPVEPTSGISGHHCFITFAEGRWYVQDDTSKFGTKVNGQP